MSQGPAQVFLIVLVWMISAFSNLKRKDWKDKFLAYDNMSFGQPQSSQKGSATSG